MSNVVDSVFSSLENILRYIAPGFVALFILIFVENSFSPFQHGPNSRYPDWVNIIIAVITGFLIYSIHKSVFAHIFWRIVISLQRHLTKQRWVPDSYRLKSTAQIMFDLDTERWKRRASNDKEVLSIQKELDKWSSMLNFLYCSSYPMILIPLGTKCMCPNFVNPCWLYLFCTGLVVLLFALISECRITIREFWAVKTYPAKRINNDQRADT